MKKSSKSEPIASCEIGSFLHENKGKATVKTYTAVNEPLKVDAADRTRQIGKVRVEMHVIESKNVVDNQIYQKDVEMFQIRDDATPSETSEMSSSSVNPSGAVPKDGLTPLQVLKNFVDNIAKGQRLHTALIVGAVAIAVAAFVMVLLK